jgi:hypothetical protein
MRVFLSRRVQSRQKAITDVYDEENHTFLVRYPVWLVVGLGLTGVLVFMLTGFLGFRDHAEPELTGRIFHEPWTLYLWFSGLILVLQISILRNIKLRRELAATLTVTILSVIILGVLYFNPGWVNTLLTLLQNLLSKIFGPHFLLSLPLTYTLLNFLIIGIFWLDTIRRWIRRLRGESPTRRIDLVTGEPTFKAGEDDLPTMEELVSGDLVAGAFLVLVLALVLRQEVVSFFLNTIGVIPQHPITACTVSLPGACYLPPLPGQPNPPTLTFIDLIQSLIYLPLGLIILAIFATLRGLGALNALGGQQASPTLATTTRDASSAVIAGEQVSIAVLDTLRAALSRRIYIALDGLIGSLRNVVWPALIFLGVVAVEASAHYIQQYLHLQSDERTCISTHCQDYVAVQRLLSEQVQYTAPVSALLWGIVAVLAIVFSAAILIYRWRVAENSLRLLGLIGLTVLLTFWIFSLALSGLNALFSLTHISARVPFPQPGISTMISVAALVIFGGYSWWRTIRNRRGAQSLPVAARSERSDASKQ